MKSRTWALLVAALLAIAVPPTLSAQKGDKRAERERKAAEAREKEAAAFHDLRTEVQPQVDRAAVRFLQHSVRDPLVTGYINSVGQGLIPEEASQELAFSFRVLNDHRPNAFALPDGRIFVTAGLLAFVDNEAQLATVLGHEIAHVVENHTLEAIRRSRNSEKRNKLIGAAAGAALGGILGGKKGGAKAAVGAAAAGAAAGAVIASAVNGFLRGKYSRQQEREADLIGAEIAMSSGFDPEEGARLFEKLRDRFGRKGRGVGNALMGAGRSEPVASAGDVPIPMALNTHPRADLRAAGIRSLISGDLKDRFTTLRTSGELSTGSGRFERMTSGLLRDASILLAERADRYDLALEGLEKARKTRPNDPRVLWALGRIYRLAGRTESHLEKARDYLTQAAEADHRRLFPAIHRDLAYLHATRENQFPAASESLKQYVLGYIAKHGSYPGDLEEIFDHLILFGDAEWTPPALVQPEPLVTRSAYQPVVWQTPGGALNASEVPRFTDESAAAFDLSLENE